MLNEEFNSYSQQHDYPPAQTPLAAHGVRRRRAIPTIQLSRATISAIILGLFAGMTFGVGVAQLRSWDAEGMTVIEGQRAIADFIAVAALAVLFALGAMVIWGVSAITTRQSANFERVARWHAEWGAGLDAVLKGQEKLGLRVIAMIDEVRKEHVREITELRAFVIARHDPDVGRVELLVGRLAHRLEVSEAKAREACEGADEANGRLDVLEVRLKDARRDPS